MNKGCFLKGHTPWNKDKKGIHLHIPTQFKAGEFVGDNHPSWRGGVQVMQKDCVYVWAGNGARKRRPREMYLKQYGFIPKGDVIWHIDMDKHNDDISNLESISRAEMIKRNSNTGKLIEQGGNKDENRNDKKE